MLEMLSGSEATGDQYLKSEKLLRLVKKGETLRECSHGKRSVLVTSPLHQSRTMSRKTKSLNSTIFNYPILIPPVPYR
jgi:hypothetical protein